MKHACLHVNPSCSSVHGWSHVTTGLFLRLGILWLGVDVKLRAATKLPDFELSRPAWVCWAGRLVRHETSSRQAKPQVDAVHVSPPALCWVVRVENVTDLWNWEPWEPWCIAS